MSCLLFSTVFSVAIDYVYIELEINKSTLYILKINTGIDFQKRSSKYYVYKEWLAVPMDFGGKCGLEILCIVFGSKISFSTKAFHS